MPRRLHTFRRELQMPARRLYEAFRSQRGCSRGLGDSCRGRRAEINTTEATMAARSVDVRDLHGAIEA